MTVRSGMAALAAAILSMPTLAHTFHTPAATHGKTLSLICAGVLLALFFVTLPAFLRGGESPDSEPPRWSLALTVGVLGFAIAGTLLAISLPATRHATQT